MSLVGRRFAGLVVLEYSHDACRTSYWKCRCDCGRETVVAKSNLKNTRSCGCLTKAAGKNLKNWRGHGDISASWMSHFQAHARFREIECKVDIAYLWELFCKQERRCALTGLTLTFPTQMTKRRDEGTTSFDFINSSCGYVEGNVQWVHKDVNFMKQALTQERFIEMCTLVFEKARQSCAS